MIFLLSRTIFPLYMRECLYRFGMVELESFSQRPMLGALHTILCRSQ